MDSQSHEVSFKRPNNGRKRSVFVVDDHPVVRAGVAQIINREPDLVMAGEGEDAYESLRRILELKPDVVLLDIWLQGPDGIELLKELKSQLPDLPVLILSMHEEALYAERALRAGARGYVMKQEPATVLVAAIRTVLNGGVHLSDGMGGTLVKRMVAKEPRRGNLPMDRLTDRELEVFRLIGLGLSTKQIAARLLLSGKTVETHRQNIKDKLNLSSGSELLLYAIHNAPGSPGARLEYLTVAGAGPM